MSRKTDGSEWAYSAKKLSVLSSVAQQPDLGLGLPHY